MPAHSPRRLLEASEIETRLSALPGWAVRAGKLHRELVFPTFERAWGFMTSLAIVAQAMDHHPAFHNEYTRVVLEISTHDLGGLSTWDFEFAESAEKLLSG